MKKSPPPVTVKELSYRSNFITHYDAIKQKFLSGESVRVIDYPESEWHTIIRVLAVLQDEMPIVRNWKTLSQSYLSETRTRAISYHIPLAFLRSGVCYE